MAVPVYADEQIMLPVETWTAFATWLSSGFTYSNDSVTETTNLSGEFSGSIQGTITNISVGSSSGTYQFSSTDVQQFVGYLGAIDTSAYLEMGDTSTAGLDDIQLTIDFTEGNGSQETINCSATSNHRWVHSDGSADDEYDSFGCTWSPALKASVEVSEDSPTYVRLGHLRNDMMTFGYAEDNPDSMLFLDGATTGSTSGSSSIYINENGTISGTFSGTIELEGTTSYNQSIDLPWLDFPSDYSISNKNNGILVPVDTVGNIVAFMYNGDAGVPAYRRRNLNNTDDYNAATQTNAIKVGNYTVVYYYFAYGHNYFRLYFTDQNFIDTYKICPLYVGSAQEVPDSIAQLIGWKSGTNQRLDTIIKYINTGNDSTSTAANDQTTNNMNTVTQQHEQLEQGYKDDVTEALSDIPTSDSAFNNGSFLNSMNWIKFQIDNWVLNDNPFVALSVTILLVGVIAVFIGRL